MSSCQLSYARERVLYYFVFAWTGLEKKLNNIYLDVFNYSNRISKVGIFFFSNLIEFGVPNNKLRLHKLDNPNLESLTKFDIKINIKKRNNQNNWKQALNFKCTWLIAQTAAPWQHKDIVIKYKEKGRKMIQLKKLN